MKQLYKNIGKFAFSVFSKAGSIEHLRKLKQETNEAINEPDNIEEYADCLICLFAATNKAGISFEDLLNETQIKLGINECRTWQELPDGTHQHHDTTTD